MLFSHRFFYGTLQAQPVYFPGPQYFWAAPPPNQGRIWLLSLSPRCTFNPLKANPRPVLQMSGPGKCLWLWQFQILPLILCRIIQKPHFLVYPKILRILIVLDRDQILLKGSNFQLQPNPSHSWGKNETVIPHRGHTELINEYKYLEIKCPNCLSLIIITWTKIPVKAPWFLH